MHKGFCISALFFSASLISLSQAQTPHTWEVGDNGKLQELPAVPTTTAAPEPLLDQVAKLIANGNPSDAKDLLIPWVTTHPDSPFRDRGVFLLAEANYRLGHRTRAFYNLEELLDYYPGSPYFQLSLQRQFEIANAYLNGYNDDFLGMAIVGGEDKAIEMMFRIQQRAPGSVLAERALLATADYYYNDGQPDLAEETFAAYVRTYPRSANVPLARLLQAKSAMQQFRGTKFDATTIINAEQELKNLMVQDPEFADHENVPNLIHQIDDQIAQKYLQTADFYRSTHLPRSAAYYYRLIAKLYPDFPAAQTALEHLRQLPAWAQVPNPAPYVPMTPLHAK